LIHEGEYFGLIKLNGMNWSLGKMDRLLKAITSYEYGVDLSTAGMDITFESSQRRGPW